MPSNRSSQSNTGDLFASARATLKQTAPPVENPINPSAYGLPSAKRRGQPTLNVGADKMADFLKELKAKRLRKISNAPDGSFVVPAPPNSSLDSEHAGSRSVSLEDRSILSQLPLRPPRPSTVNLSQGASAGKRKRGTDSETNSSISCKSL